MTLFNLDTTSLVTYYMLPLAEVNKYTFAKNFKATYINRKGNKLYVELKKPMVSPIYKRSKYYLTDVLIKDKFFVEFVLPEKYKKDIELFLIGKYSKMSKEVKLIIYKTSTLPYNVKMENFVMSHPVLHALGKTKRLRSFLLDYFNVQELSSSEELIDIPKDDWFIEHRINELTLKQKEHEV